MFNKALFKLEWKSNYKILVIFCLILTMYTTIMLAMYDPKLGTALETFAKSMPEIMAMVGMSGTPTTLIDFLSTYLYGLIMIVFPLIFGILLALRLVVRKVDNGVMSYLLCSGVERRSVWFTQMLVIITNLFVLIAFCTGLGLGCSALMFPGDLDIGAYLVLNLGVFILQLTLTGICYMCSCIFNEYRLASLFGAGIPIVFIMIQMLSNMQGSMEGLKFATLLTLFDPQKLINGNNEGYLMLGGLLVEMIVCYGVGGIIFDRKSMSL